MSHLNQNEASKRVLRVIWFRTGIQSAFRESFDSKRGFKRESFDSERGFKARFANHLIQNVFSVLNQMTHETHFEAPFWVSYGHHLPGTQKIVELVYFIIIRKFRRAMNQERGIGYINMSGFEHPCLPDTARAAFVCVCGVSVRWIRVLWSVGLGQRARGVALKRRVISRAHAGIPRRTDSVLFIVYYYRTFLRYWYINIIFHVLV